MEERPILLSTPMVIATIEDLKNQTRRTKGLEEINKNPNNWRYIDKLLGSWKDKSGFIFRFISNENKPINISCPYGQVGDVLWVRETFCPVMPPMMPGDEIPDYCNYIYKASDELPIDYKWKPSIFMPREACRIRLEITNIRVERLQDISEQDAMAEGIEFRKDIAMWKSYLSSDTWYGNSIWSYQSLWEKINGKDSWDLNPWVWVIEFKKL